MNSETYDIVLNFIVVVNLILNVLLATEAVKNLLLDPPRRIKNIFYIILFVSVLFIITRIFYLYFQSYNTRVFLPLLYVGVLSAFYPLLRDFRLNIIRERRKIAATRRIILETERAARELDTHLTK